MTTSDFLPYIGRAVSMRLASGLVIGASGTAIVETVSDTGLVNLRVGKGLHRLVDAHTVVTLNVFPEVVGAR